MTNGKRENLPKFSDNTTPLEDNPPNDNPLLRHEKNKEDAEYGSENKNLAQLRANAIRRASKMISGNCGNISEDSDDDFIGSVRETQSGPPEDDPMLRHKEEKQDIVFGSESKKLADLRAAAIKQASTMGNVPHDKGRVTVAPTPGSSNWVQMGPLAIPNGQTYGGARVLVSGRITNIIVDPTDSNVIYVGTAQGGVWKTSDGGGTWLPTQDNEISLAVGALAMDPTNHLILYVGTGEGNFAGDSYYGNGILKSTNGGNSWSLFAQATFSGARFCRIVINPATPSTLFAATTFGVFRSTNGGIDWTLLSNGLPTISGTIRGATDLVIDPVNPDVVYCSFWAGGIYKTNDANSANPLWAQLTSGLPSSGFTRIALSISGSSPQTVYALISGPFDPDVSLSYLIDKFYFTTNGGTSWNAIGLPGGNIGGQGFYNLFVISDPTTPDIVYLGATELWKAVYNSGTGIWTITKIGGTIHPDTHAFAFDPSNHLKVFCGSDGGIYKSNDAGMTWIDSINEGLCITQFEFMDQHPTSDAIVLAGTQDNGTEQFRNSPVFYHAADGDGGFCGIDPSNQNIYFHTYYGPSPERSTNAGKFGSWIGIDTGLTGSSLFYPPLALNQSDPNNIAFGTDVISIDNMQGTAGWGTTVSLPNLGSHLVSAINYVNSNLIYAGTNKGKAYRLVQSGGSWTATEISASPLPSRYIWDISPLPSDVNTVILIMSGFGSGHVWRGVVPSSGPATWTDISGSGMTGLPDIPVNALAIEPISSSTMYVGTDIGVFRTTNSGATWTNFSQGLPNVADYDMRLHISSRILRVVTHGRGMWERKLDVATMPDVEIFVRDNLMDTGRAGPSPQFIPAGFEDPLQHLLLGDNVARWQCADIKIDALEGSPPNYQMNVADVDYLAFEAKLEHRNAQRGRVNRLYVQVHNRGIRPANNVTVKILYATASAGLPPLPGDFWTAFPGDSMDTTNWKPIGPAKVIPVLSNTKPEILEWDWATPSTAATHTCILMISDCPDDPIAAANKIFNVDNLGLIERHVGFKNLHVVDAIPGTFYWTPFDFFGEPKETFNIRIPPSQAKGWSIGMIFQKDKQQRMKTEGFSIKEPTKAMLLSLRKKIRGEVKNYDTSQIYMVDTISEGGLIADVEQSKNGMHTMLLFIPPTGNATSGTLSIVQEDDQKMILGGSTFVLRRKKTK